MAYALGPIRPDERHERIFVRRRSRRVLVIVLAVLAMLGSSGAFFAFYHAMTRPAAPADVPLLRADTAPTRHKPDNPGGIEIPGQGTMVLDGGQGEPKVEQLLPPPETPLPRPTPPETIADSPAPAAMPAPPPAPALAAPAAAAPPPAAPPPVAAAEPAPPAAAPRPPVAAAKPAAHAAQSRGYRLQVGAVRSPEAAKQEWEHLKRQHAEVLGALGFATERVDLGARGVFYRIQAGPIADAAKAERDCNELKRRGVGCLLVKP